MTTVIVLPAELTHATADACVAMAGQSIRAAGAGDVLVQAGGLHDFDSSALAVLLETRRIAHAAGHGWTIADLPPRLAQLAGLYGVGELLCVTAPAP